MRLFNIFRVATANGQSLVWTICHSLMMNAVIFGPVLSEGWDTYCTKYPRSDIRTEGVILPGAALHTKHCSDRAIGSHLYPQITHGSVHNGAPIYTAERWHSEQADDVTVGQPISNQRRPPEGSGLDTLGRAAALPVLPLSAGAVCVLPLWMAPQSEIITVAFALGRPRFCAQWP